MLPSGGYWVVAEATGDIPLLEAEWSKVNGSDPFVRQFWETYHQKRGEISPFDPELKTCKMEKANYTKQQAFHKPHFLGAIVEQACYF